MTRLLLSAVVMLCGCACPKSDHLVITVEEWDRFNPSVSPNAKFEVHDGAKTSETYFYVGSQEGGR